MITSLITILAGMLIVGLVTYGIVETIHHSSLFRELKDYLETSSSMLDQLVNCPHCISYYVSAWAALAYLITIPEFESGLSGMFLLCWFGGRKIASLMNDLLRKVERMHTPHFEESDATNS